MESVLARAGDMLPVQIDPQSCPFGSCMWAVVGIELVLGSGRLSPTP